MGSNFIEGGEFLVVVGRIRFLVVVGGLWLGVFCGCGFLIVSVLGLVLNLCMGLLFFVYVICFVYCFVVDFFECFYDFCVVWFVG